MIGSLTLKALYHLNGFFCCCFCLLHCFSFPWGVFLMLSQFLIKTFIIYPKKKYTCQYRNIINIAANFICSSLHKEMKSHLLTLKCQIKSLKTTFLTYKKETHYSRAYVDVQI